jgi:hypothetical protein
MNLSLENSLARFFFSNPCNFKKKIPYINLDRTEEKMSSTNETKHVPWYLLPFWAIWRLVAMIVGMTGRLLAVILGFLLMLLGVLVSLTVVGLIIGVPMILLGVLLVVRGLF